MRSGSSVLRILKPVDGSDQARWATRLTLLAAYREDVLNPARAPHEAAVTGLDSVIEGHPALRRHRSAARMRQLGLQNLSELPLDILMAACRSQGRREELARCAGIFYALSGVGALSQAEFQALLDRFPREVVTTALAEPGTARRPLPTPETIESIGRYAVRLALSQNPILAGWEALQPVAMPDRALERARLLSAVRRAAQQLGLEL